MKFFKTLFLCQIIILLIGSEDPYTSGAAARKILRAVGMKDMLTATFCDTPQGVESGDYE